MAYKPDYGLKLLQDGITRDVSIHFPQFLLYSITVLDYEKYSSMVEIPYDNQVYAVSIDFNHEQVQDMLKYSSKNALQPITSDIELLYKHLNIVDIMKNENTNKFFIECISALDLICLLKMKDVARFVYREVEPDLDSNIYNYHFELIRELEIDFKLFIIYAGVDFFKSNYYEYDRETGEEQVLKYLFFEHYDKVRRVSSY